MQLASLPPFLFVFIYLSLNFSSLLTSALLGMRTILLLKWNYTIKILFPRNFLHLTCIVCIITGFTKRSLFVCPRRRFSRIESLPSKAGQENASSTQKVGHEGNERKALQWGWTRNQWEWRASHLWCMSLRCQKRKLSNDA